MPVPRWVKREIWEVTNRIRCPREGLWSKESTRDDSWVSSSLGSELAPLKSEKTPALN